MDGWPTLEGVLQEVFDDALRRIERELTFFANALDSWISVLFEKRLPNDWREQYHDLLADQAARGRTATPESARELEDWIEAWAKHCGLSPEPQTAAQATTTWPDLKQHPGNPYVFYGVPINSELTEADVAYALELATAIHQLRRVLGEKIQQLEHPGVLGAIGYGISPMQAILQRRRLQAEVEDLKSQLAKLESLFEQLGFEQIQWSAFQVPPRKGLDQAAHLANSGPPHAINEITVDTLMTLYAGGTLTKTAGKLLARGALKLLAMQAARRIPRVLPKGSVWDLAPAVRGEAIEEFLGRNVPKTFDTIDKSINGIMTSIKSIDLGAKTYQNPQSLARVVRGYIDKVAEFMGAKRAGFEISPSEIKGRALELAVPPQATVIQRQVLNELTLYGRGKGVIVKIVEVR